VPATHRHDDLAPPRTQRREHIISAKQLSPEVLFLPAGNQVRGGPTCRGRSVSGTGRVRALFGELDRFGAALKVSECARWPWILYKLAQALQRRADPNVRPRINPSRRAVGLSNHEKDRRQPGCAPRAPPGWGGPEAEANARLLHDHLLRVAPRARLPTKVGGAGGDDNDEEFFRCRASCFLVRGTGERWTRDWPLGFLASKGLGLASPGPCGAKRRAKKKRQKGCSLLFLPNFGAASVCCYAFCVEGPAPLFFFFSPHFFFFFFSFFFVFFLPLHRPKNEKPNHWPTARQQTCALPENGQNFWRILHRFFFFWQTLPGEEVSGPPPKAGWREPAPSASPVDCFRTRKAPLRRAFIQKPGRTASRTIEACRSRLADGLHCSCRGSDLPDQADVPASARKFSVARA